MLIWFLSWDRDMLRDYFNFSDGFADVDDYSSFVMP